MNNKLSILNNQDSHLAYVYDSLNSFIVSLAKYVREGIDQHEAVVIIATLNQQNLLRKEISKIDPTLNLILTTKQVLFMDADFILDQTYDDKSLNFEKFISNIKGISAKMLCHYSSLRFYSEVTNLICAKNKFEDAIELEKKWHAFLGLNNNISLLSSYSKEYLVNPRLQNELHKLATFHDESIINNSFNTFEKIKDPRYLIKNSISFLLNTLKIDAQKINREIVIAELLNIESMIGSLSTEGLESKEPRDLILIKKNRLAEKINEAIIIFKEINNCQEIAFTYNCGTLEIEDHDDQVIQLLHHLVGKVYEPINKELKTSIIIDIEILNHENSLEIIVSDNLTSRDKIKGIVSLNSSTKMTGEIKNLLPKVA